VSHQTQSPLPLWYQATIVGNLTKRLDVDETPDDNPAAVAQCYQLLWTIVTNARKMATCKDASSVCVQVVAVIGLGLLIFSAGSRHNSVAEQPHLVVWEVFVDPLCRNCKSGWPVVRQVAERYGSSLAVVVHPFPAP
jgi:hypothetical protein